MEHLKPPHEMDSTIDGDMSERWNQWSESMELYLDLTMSGKDEKEQCKAFLYIIG
jgi:hypothetical protein